MLALHLREEYAMIEPHEPTETEIKLSQSQVYLSAAEIMRDYSLAVQSRQASLIGRREVLSGKAKFGIFGDGKEIPQIAMAKAFRKGDFRVGYYRGQTFMFAIGATTIQEFFAQLYANPDLHADPNSAGRQMNAHFATRSLNPDGSWKNLTEQYNAAADLSPTGAQMPKLVGLGYASRLYRELASLIVLLIPGLGLLLSCARAYNHMALGEDMAMGHGVDVRRTQMLTFVGAGITTAAAVAMTGPIGFVGMIIPHVVRSLSGSDHRLILPASFLLGGAVLAACDAIARTVLAPTELPVGIITAVVGAPLFLFILLKSKR